MEDNRHKIVFTVIVVATFIVVVIGATFAYFSATSDTVKQKVTTGVLNVVATTGEVTGANIKPTTFDSSNIDEALTNPDIAQIPITVTLTGTTIDSYYNIYLTTTNVQKNADEKKEGGEYSDIKWVLISNDDTKKVLYSGQFEENSTKTDGNFTNKKLNDTNIDITPAGKTEEGTDNENIDKYILLIYIENTEDSVGEAGVEISGKQDKLQNMNIGATVTVKAYQNNVTVD